jgi:hypothetical protein
VEKFINTDTFPWQLNYEQHCARWLSVWKRSVAGKLVFKFQKTLSRFWYILYNLLYLKLKPKFIHFLLKKKLVALEMVQSTNYRLHHNLQVSSATYHVQVTKSKGQPRISLQCHNVQYIPVRNNIFPIYNKLMPRPMRYEKTAEDAFRPINLCSPVQGTLIILL